MDRYSTPCWCGCRRCPLPICCWADPYGTPCSADSCTCVPAVPSAAISSGGGSRRADHSFLVQHLSSAGLWAAEEFRLPTFVLFSAHAQAAFLPPVYPESRSILQLLVGFSPLPAWP